VRVLVLSFGPNIDLFDAPVVESVRLRRIHGGEMFEGTYPPTPPEQANKVVPPTMWSPTLFFLPSAWSGCLLSDESMSMLQQ